MRRGEIRYADVGGAWGRRPVVIVTASELIPATSGVTCAPVTSALRGLPSRFAVGRQEGLSTESEAVCEALATIPKPDIDTVPLGSIGTSRLMELDRAIARALDIRRENLPLA